jgi:aminopeptidase
MVDKRIVNCLEKALNIRKNDRVLVITDSIKERIAKKFFLACPNARMIIIKPTGQHGREPPTGIAREMLRYDKIIMVTEFSLSHTKARRDATARGIRIASMPGFTDKMMDSLDVDYEKIKKTTMLLAALMKKTRSVNITTKSGADITFYINDRMIFSDTHDQPFMNLPLGEACVAPRGASGTLVFDSYQKLIRKPTRLVIKKNRIDDFERSQNGAKLKSILTTDKSRFAAEFGVGTNYRATTIGNVLQDEKVLGTCHIAFGNNVSYGGRNNANVHIDVMLFRPTIKFDGKIVMKEGIPLWI